MSTYYLPGFLITKPIGRVDLLFLWSKSVLLSNFENVLSKSSLDLAILASVLLEEGC